MRSRRESALAPDARWPGMPPARLRSTRSSPPERPRRVPSVDRTPGVFVSLAAAQEVKFSRALAYRLGNCVCDDLRAGTEPRQIRVEAAEIGVGTTVVSK